MKLPALYTARSSSLRERICRFNYLVCDRRYRRHEIEGMCIMNGLTVLRTRYVRAGHRHVELDPENDNAKELLLLCEARD